jgi:hypothetical protein
MGWVTATVSLHMKSIYQHLQLPDGTWDSRPRISRPSLPFLGLATYVASRSTDTYLIDVMIAFLGNVKREIT